MNAFFSTAEASMLIRLLLAHCLTDFFLQPGHWVQHKRANTWRSAFLWYHGLLTGLVTWLFLWDLQAWWIVLIITLSHTIIDGIKLTLARTSRKGKQEFYLFITDQLLHVLIIILLWLSLIGGWQRMNLALHDYLPQYRILIRVLGYVIVIGPVGFLIHYLTRRWTNDLNLEDSLKDAGRWIGMLERVLIITFIYTNQFSAIGFLIAAKSVLRVTDKPENSALSTGKPFSTRKHTEYVLIGTFLSFAIAIITGLLVNWFLALSDK